jgi:hypothetical protein
VNINGLLCTWCVCVAVSARAAPDHREPTVRELQRAAARRAEVEPERVRSWLARVRRAALLPALRVRVGHDSVGVQLTHGADGIDRYALTASDSWRFEGEATWQLDRLIFDRNEIGLGRESQRTAMRREQIELDVARLYFARRRLLLEAARAPAPDEAAADRQLDIDELTAVLDGLTGGALTQGSAHD